MSTSRERLIQTLNHIQPDRVVMDMGSTGSTGISVCALDRLRKALGLEEKRIKISDPAQLLGVVDEDVRQALQLDVVGISSSRNRFGFSNEGDKPWRMPSGLEVSVPNDFNTTVDESGRTYLHPQGDISAPPSAVMPKNGVFFDMITRGNIEFDEETDSAKEDFKDDFGVFTDEVLRDLERQCENYYSNTDYGIVYAGSFASIGNFLGIPGPKLKYPKGIRDVSDFMMAHYICPNYVHDVFSMQIEAGLKNAELVYQACGNKIQAASVSGTDFGSQNGPLMSPDTFREFYKPYFKQVNDWIHKNTTWKTFFHTCGSIGAFLQDFYEAGADILNPVQLSAAGMDGKELKEKWGDKFVFWGGGIDTQKTLPFGTPEEVYDETLERLRLFSSGGGFVFNTIHNIQAPTTAENMMAMFKAVDDFQNGRI